MTDQGLASGVIAVTQVQYQPIAVPITPDTIQVDWHRQPVDPIRLEPVRITGGSTYPLQHEATEGSAQGWRSVAPDQIRTTDRAPMPSWVGPLAQAGLQYDWQIQGPTPLSRPVPVESAWASPLLVATGTEFPRGYFPDAIAAASRVAHTEFAWSTFTPSAVPGQPWTEAPMPVVHPWRPLSQALAWSTFTPPVPDQFWVRPPDPVRLIPRFTTTEFAWHPDTPVTPVPDFRPLSPVFPVWLKQWHPSLQIESRGPVFPVPTPTIQRVLGIVGHLLEQSSGSYLALLTDPSGRVVPGSMLQSLRVTLYTVNRDNTFSIVNSRDHQPCLNTNDVTVYDAVQQTATGKRYNLRWEIQPADTTLINAALPFERHLMLWEFSWAGGAGKHEATIVVHNVATVN